MYTNIEGESFIVGNNTSVYQWLTTKYDSEGDRLWSTTYSPVQSNEQNSAFSVIVDDSGNVFVTGQSFENEIWFPGSRLTLTTIKYNLSGSQIWTSSYMYESSFSGYSKGRAIAIDNEYNIYVQGYRYINGSAHTSDYLLLKYSNTGSILSELVYNYEGDDGRGNWLDPILVEGEQIFVSFESEPCSTCQGLDVVTVEYSQESKDNLLLVEQSDLPIEYKLFQNYPNPFNPVTRINYTLKENSSVSIIVYDILGRSIKTLVSDFQIAGVKSVTWDGTNYYGTDVASGIYIYKIIAGNFIDTKKMLLLK